MLTQSRKHSLINFIVVIAIVKWWTDDEDNGLRARGSASPIQKTSHITIVLNDQA